MLNLDQSAKIKLAVILVIVVALQSSIADCFREFRLLHKNEKTQVSEIDRRFREIRKELPAHGVVGYVSDGQFDVKKFYLTQYALAPLLIVRSTKAQFIIAYFKNHASLPQFCKENSMSVIRIIEPKTFLLKRIR